MHKVNSLKYKKGRIRSCFPRPQRLHIPRFRFLLHSGKGKTIGMIKSEGMPGARGGGPWIGENILYDTKYVSLCIWPIPCNIQHQEWTVMWTMASGWQRCIKVSSWVPLWWRMLIADRLCLCRAGDGVKSLYLPLSFAVNLKLIWNNKAYWWRKENDKAKTNQKYWHATLVVYCVFMCLLCVCIWIDTKLLGHSKGMLCSPMWETIRLQIGLKWMQLLQFSL